MSDCGQCATNFRENNGPTEAETKTEKINLLQRKRSLRLAENAQRSPKVFPRCEKPRNVSLGIGPQGSVCTDCCTGCRVSARVNCRCTRHRLENPAPASTPGWTPGCTPQAQGTCTYKLERPALRGFMQRGQHLADFAAR